MFNFRIINTPDGNQIIDEGLKTPYNSLTPVEMVEYKEVEDALYYEEIQKRKQRREEERKQKLTYRFIHKLAYVCGIV